MNKFKEFLILKVQCLTDFFCISYTKIIIFLTNSLDICASTYLLLFYINFFFFLKKTKKQFTTTDILWFGAIQNFYYARHAILFKTYNCIFLQLYNAFL